jgi:hypothetical protein
MSGTLALGDTVAVMHLLGPVEAKAYGKALCCQKTAPVLIEKSAICLDTIGDALMRGLMLPLQGHNLPEVAEPQEDRLSTMPGKIDHRTGRSGDVLDDIFLQDGVGHPKRLALWIEVLLLEIVTVVTVQVADGPGGFDKNLKFAGGFIHFSIPNPRRTSLGVDTYTIESEN